MYLAISAVFLAPILVLSPIVLRMADSQGDCRMAMTEATNSRDFDAAMRSEACREVAADAVVGEALMRQLSK
jgi:hypothetical protein